MLYRISIFFPIFLQKLRRNRNRPCYTTRGSSRCLATRSRSYQSSPPSSSCHLSGNYAPTNYLCRKQAAKSMLSLRKYARSGIIFALLPSPCNWAIFLNRLLSTENWKQVETTRFGTPALTLQFSINNSRYISVFSVYGEKAGILHSVAGFVAHIFLPNAYFTTSYSFVCIRLKRKHVKNSPSPASRTSFFPCGNQRGFN